MEIYRPPAHGGQHRWAADVFGGDASRWLDFSANLNPLGPPRSVLEVLSRSLDEVASYPDLEALDARGAIAAYLGVDPQHLLVTSGGIEAIFLVVRAFSPSLAFIKEPAFGGYREALAAAGVRAVGVDRPLREMLEMELPERSLVIVGHPANPTGQLEDRAVLLQLRARLATGCGLLLLDEAFVDFLEDPGAVSLRSEVQTGPGLAVAGSLTKFFTLPGLRIGYGLAAPDLMPALRRQQVPWSVGSLAQVAATAAVADQAFSIRSRRFFPPVRRELLRQLQRTSAFRIEEGRANYLLLDASPSLIPASAWVYGAARRGILLRDASRFEGLSPYHLRIAVRTPAENELLASVIREILGEAKPKA